VNWHITLWCNLSCRFCYQQTSDRSLPTGPRLSMSLPEAFRLLDLLREAGCEKITFAGGEPTLVPELPDLIRHSRARGMRVMLVTNGTGVTESFLGALAGCLDAVKLSIDSPFEETLIALGRSRGHYLERIKASARSCHARGVPVMVNTVVTSLNCVDDLHQLLAEVNPVRWKIFRALWIEGQNTGERDNLAPTDAQFEGFVARHKDLPYRIPEDSDAMTDSYVMVDPLGRFHQNSDGKYRYSSPILEVGVAKALSEAGGWSREKFLLRGGSYELGSRGSPAKTNSRLGASGRAHRGNPDAPSGWRIRIDPRAEVGALFNLKHRMLDWFRNNPGAAPDAIRIRVERRSSSVLILPRAQRSLPAQAVRDALAYAQARATKSQRFVAGAVLEVVT
jgi:radical S-adenosyl methionine domain-containing protein 2